MQRRLDMVRNHMEKNEIDACVFTSYHNVHYFSDFLYCYFGRPYAFIVTPKKTTSVSAGKDISCVFWSVMWYLLKRCVSAKSKTFMFLWCWTSRFQGCLSHALAAIEKWKGGALLTLVALTLTMLYLLPNGCQTVHSATDCKVYKGNGYGAWQNSLVHVFVGFFGLDTNTQYKFCPRN